MRKYYLHETEGTPDVAGEPEDTFSKIEKEYRRLQERYADLMAKLADAQEAAAFQKARKVEKHGRIVEYIRDNKTLEQQLKEKKAELEQVKKELAEQRGTGVQQNRTDQEITEPIIVSAVPAGENKPVDVELIPMSYDDAKQLAQARKGLDEIMRVETSSVSPDKHPKKEGSPEQEPEPVALQTESGIIKKNNMAKNEFIFGPGQGASFPEQLPVEAIEAVDKDRVFKANKILGDPAERASYDEGKKQYISSRLTPLNIVLDTKPDLQVTDIVPLRLKVEPLTSEESELVRTAASEVEEMLDDGNSLKIEVKPEEGMDETELAGIKESQEKEHIEFVESMERLVLETGWLKGELERLAKDDSKNIEKINQHIARCDKLIQGGNLFKNIAIDGKVNGKRVTHKGEDGNSVESTLKNIKDRSDAKYELVKKFYIKYVTNLSVDSALGKMTPRHSRMNLEEYRVKVLEKEAQKDIVNEDKRKAEEICRVDYDGEEEDFQEYLEEKRKKWKHLSPAIYHRMIVNGYRLDLVTVENKMITIPVEGGEDVHIANTNGAVKKFTLGANENKSEIVNEAKARSAVDVAKGSLNEIKKDFLAEDVKRFRKYIEKQEGGAVFDEIFQEYFNEELKKSGLSQEAFCRMFAIGRPINTVYAGEAEVWAEDFTQKYTDNEVAKRKAGIEKFKSGQDSLKVRRERVKKDITEKVLAMEEGVQGATPEAIKLRKPEEFNAEPVEIKPLVVVKVEKLGEPIVSDLSLSGGKLVPEEEARPVEEIKQRIQAIDDEIKKLTPGFFQNLFGGAFDRNKSRMLDLKKEKKILNDEYVKIAQLGSPEAKRVNSGSARGDDARFAETEEKNDKLRGFLRDLVAKYSALEKRWEDFDPKSEFGQEMKKNVLQTIVGNKTLNESIIDSNNAKRLAEKDDAWQEEALVAFRTFEDAWREVLEEENSLEGVKVPKAKVNGSPETGVNDKKEDEAKLNLAKKINSAKIFSKLESTLKEDEKILEADFVARQVKKIKKLLNSYAKDKNPKALRDWIDNYYIESVFSPILNGEDDERVMDFYQKLKIYLDKIESGKGSVKDLLDYADKYL